MVPAAKTMVTPKEMDMIVHMTMEEFFVSRGEGRLREYKLDMVVQIVYMITMLAPY